MRKIVVLSMISLDGVMQAPGGPKEDPSGGFKYGGWSFPYQDEVSGKIVVEQISQPNDLLLGKKTYDIFAAYWPKQTGPIADAFNKSTKYVVSNEEFEPDWNKTVVIAEDCVAELNKLKDSDGPMLQVHGSGNLIQTLLKNDLVDELWLKIFPITLGLGKKLFAEGTIPAEFKLIDQPVTAPSGVILANYKRSGKVKTGSFE